MGQIEYYFIRLNEGLYETELREKLGTFFDLGTNYCGLRGQEIAQVFVVSGLAEQFERQNPHFVAGMSGAELLQWSLDECGWGIQVTNPPRDPISADYWVGYMLGLFQVVTGWTYRQLFARMSYADLREMHSWCQELSEREFVEELLSQLRQRERPSALRRLRKEAGLTQVRLAERAGISARAVQQYEEGLKDINKAAAGTVRRLAFVLGCRMEDLLEPPSVHV